MVDIIRLSITIGIIFFVVALGMFFWTYFKEKKKQKQQQSYPVQYGQPAQQFGYNNPQAQINGYNGQQPAQQYPTQYPNPNTNPNLQYDNYITKPQDIPVQSYSNPANLHSNTNQQNEAINQQLAQIEAMKKQMEAQMQKMEAQAKSMELEAQQKKFNQAVAQSPIPVPMKSMKTQEEEVPSINEKKEGEILGRVHFHIKLPQYADKMVEDELKSKFESLIEPELKAFKKKLQKQTFDVEIEYEVV